jgi:hypothetical protein
VLAAYGTPDCLGLLSLASAYHLRSDFNAILCHLEGSAIVPGDSNYIHCTFLSLHHNWLERSLPTTSLLTLRYCLPELNHPAWPGRCIYYCILQQLLHFQESVVSLLLLCRALVYEEGLGNNIGSWMGGNSRLPPYLLVVLTSFLLLPYLTHTLPR